MRFTGFKDTIPMVRSIKKISPQKMRGVVNFVHIGIKKLLTGFGLNEFYYSGERRKYEPILFPETCEYVCRFLMKNAVQVTKGVPKMACGTEGCAYFYGDKVLKCTLGKHEWIVAGMLKGDKDFFPVIDTDREPETGVYLILSWKLDT